jgi:hypothetical protein
MVPPGWTFAKVVTLVAAVLTAVAGVPGLVTAGTGNLAHPLPAERADDSEPTERTSEGSEKSDGWVVRATRRPVHTDCHPVRATARPAGLDRSRFIAFPRPPSPDLVVSLCRFLN